MNIVLATDSNYLPYAETLLKSLCCHSREMNIFVLHMNSISQEWADKLNFFLNRCDSSIRLVNVDKRLLALFSHANEYITKETYLRYYIEYLFEYAESENNWLYLDCDMIVNGDISLPFTFPEFKNYPLAAVADPFVSKLQQHPFRHKNYFNAGVMYINAELWRGSGAYLSYFTHNNKLIYGDQDALNMVFDQWLALPCIYNFQLEHFLDVTHVQESKLKLSPIVIHFTGPDKPWHSEKHFLHKIYQCYESLTWDDITASPIGTYQLVFE